MLLPLEILEETIKIGYSKDGNFCIRDRENAFLLKTGRPGDHTARIIADTVPVPDDFEFQFVTHEGTLIYDDDKKVVQLIANDNSFYVSPDSKILIQLHDSFAIEIVPVFIRDCYYEREEKRHGPKIGSYY